jgi:DNA polymerase-3 subunit beta
MKAICQQDQLARGLAIVGRAVAIRSTLPVLSNILIVADGPWLRLSATNLEVGITCTVPAQIDEAGSITVPARLLSDLFMSLQAPEVTMELNEDTQTLHLSADRFEADVKGIDAADFPVLPTVEQGVRFSLSPVGLRDMLTRVTIAAASDESRPILTGVLTSLEPDAGRMTLVAADGFRLSVYQTELTAPLPGPIQIIIPSRALVELGRIVTEEDEAVDVAITDSLSQILFRTRQVDLVSQLIKGTYPDHEKIMPTSHTTRAVANTKAFYSIVRVASFFARDAANVVRVSIKPAEGQATGSVEVSAQAAEVGTDRGEVEASVDGLPLDIAFNAKYLMDILNVIGSDQIAIECTDPGHPGVFRPTQEDGFTHVIMPMHIGR